MVLAVDFASRPLLSAALKDMHRVRKSVFVDRLRWTVPVDGEGREIDQFDHSGAVYILSLDRETGAHLSSARLLPTTEPHVLGDLFPDLCAQGAPCAHNVWEISRYCVTPGLSREEALQARYGVTAGMLEFAIAQGVDTYVCVIDLSWLPTFLSVGWAVDPLGAPRAHEGQMIGAFAMAATPETLTRYYALRGIAGPVLERLDRLAA